jgi:hypothetical protein
MKQETKIRLLMLLLALALARVLFCPNVAFASDSGACYVVTDSDARTYCLARAHREVGTCYAIKDAGLRSQCLAEVRR